MGNPSSESLRARLSERDNHARIDRRVDLFLSMTAGVHFEMRFQGEDRWWPARADDVARTLVEYHASLRKCLAAMLRGQDIGSRLSVYRIKTPQIDTSNE